MSTRLITVGPRTPFLDIVETLLENNINGLPVIDAGGTLLGIVTESDLITKEAYEGYDEVRRRRLGLLRDHLPGHDHEHNRKAAGRVAMDLMTSKVQTVSPDDDLATAARLMLEGHHKSLPVVASGSLVGIVARHDLLRPFHRSDEELADDIAAALADPGRTPEAHEVTFTAHKGIVVLHGTARTPSDVEVVVAAIAAIPGVVAIDDDLGAREPEPQVARGFSDTRADL